MKSIILISLFVIWPFSQTYSQRILMEKINFIIVLNEDINPIINSIKIKIVTKTKDTINYKAKYIPGSLEIDKKFFDDLKKLNIKTIILEISYTNKNNYNHSHCKIKGVRTWWFKSYYFILYIYDKKVKKYRRLFNFSKNNDCVYEYDTPNGISMKLARKKHIFFGIWY